MDVEARVRQQRAEILRIATEHGASNLRIFGSVARGQARSDSDVDVLVELEPGRSLFDHVALQLELEQLLGCHVDVVTERGLRPGVRERVLHDAVRL
jgi:uncharacterized protein